MLKKISIITQDLLFSRHCYLCLRPRLHLFAICRPCLTRLPYIEHRCPKCGIELLTTQLCGQCIQAHIPIHQTMPTFRYEGLIKDAVIQLKHHQGLYLTAPLARFMQDQLKMCYATNIKWPLAILAVPLHHKKLSLRGYNQAYALSQQLTHLLNIPDLSHQIIKTQHTTDQSSLPLKQRKKNIKQAFDVLEKLPRHVAIVDDVMTTGETVKQLATTLRKHGAKKVDVWCLARTSLPHLS